MNKIPDSLIARSDAIAAANFNSLPEHAKMAADSGEAAYKERFEDKLAELGITKPDERALFSTIMGEFIRLSTLVENYRGGKKGIATGDSMSQIIGLMQFCHNEAKIVSKKIDSALQDVKQKGSN